MDLNFDGHPPETSVVMLGGDIKDLRLRHAFYGLFPTNKLVPSFSDPAEGMRLIKNCRQDGTQHGLIGGWLDRYGQNDCKREDRPRVGVVPDEEKGNQTSKSED